MIATQPPSSVPYNNYPMVETSFDAIDHEKGKNLLTFNHFLSDDISRTSNCIDDIIPNSPFDILQINQDYSLAKITTQINHTIQLDKEFLINDGIDIPNEMVINYACQIIKEISETNNFPYRISTLADEGLSIQFKNNNKSLHYEIYNDGDVGYIIEDSYTGDILDNEDLNSLSESINRIEKFYSDL